jgi:hypothetical protein
MAVNYTLASSENSFYLQFDMPQSRTYRTAGQQGEHIEQQGKSPSASSNLLVCEDTNQGIKCRDGSKLHFSKFRELVLSTVRHSAKPNISNSRANQPTVRDLQSRTAIEGFVILKHESPLALVLNNHKGWRGFLTRARNLSLSFCCKISGK